MNNNPTVISKKVNKTTNILFDGYKINHIDPNFNISMPSVNADIKNYWNPHLEGKWFDADRPTLLVLSQEGIELINWNLSIYKGSLYFDHNENYSLYISMGNVNAYVGINYEKGIGLDVGTNVLEIGYDGKFF